MIMDLSRCGLFNKHLDYFFFKSLFTFLYILALLIFCPLNFSVTLATLQRKLRRAWSLLTHVFKVKESKPFPVWIRSRFFFYFSQIHAPLWLLVKDGGGGERDIYVACFYTKLSFCIFLTTDHSAWQALPQIFPYLISCLPGLSSNVPSQKLITLSQAGPQWI